MSFMQKQIYYGSYFEIDTTAGVEIVPADLINGDYESGFHAGQTDDPKKIARQAFDNGAQKVVFRMKESSQFYIVFQGFALYEED